MPRTCQWPNNSGATDFDDTVEACGITEPSFDAHIDPTVDPLPVCDKHAEKAKTAGYDITPAGATLHQVPPSDPGPQDTTPEDPAQRLSTDARDELTVMRSIVEELETFPTDAQRRIVAWAADFYGVPL